MKSFPNRAWVEVNLDNIIHNYNVLKKSCNQQTKIMPVIKADAYGHGAVIIAKELENNHADYFAVATLDEAIELRNAQIKTPVLIFTHIDLKRSKDLISNDITQTVYSYDYAKKLSEVANKMNKRLKVHVKIDTGMSRVGLGTNQEDVDEVVKISKLNNIEVEGIYSHLAAADEEDTLYTRIQLEKFISFEKKLNETGLVIPIKHISNSAATIRFEDFNLDMVRIGISLYGCYPCGGKVIHNITLKPALQFKTQVVYIKDVECGTKIGYGCTFETKRKSKIATITVGYADGFSRLLSETASVLISGQRAPIVGRICMDQCMVDVSDIRGEINIGSEVVLYGKQGDIEIRCDEIANLLGTINYEVLCMINRRVPRFYIRNDTFVDSKNYLIN